MSDLLHGVYLGVGFALGSGLVAFAGRFFRFFATINGVGVREPSVPTAPNAEQ